MTTKQYKQKLWYQYQAGLITASNMKEACHTNLINPAKSLIKKMCYPFEHYLAGQKPFAGRSWLACRGLPTVVVDCNCCGQGVVEMKCPWCQQQQKIDENIPNYLVKQNANYTISKSCNYYYQMQTQIFVCNVEYCEFVVWIEKSLHIEKINPIKVYIVEQYH
ncbi:uncharacterized protein [Centruroides vittatus]|uniref:uncharacterized protein n=1 Tax=Centruroides vittatus TaxID=120091 RepID=UPI00350F220F